MSTKQQPAPGRRHRAGPARVGQALRHGLLVVLVGATTGLGAAALTWVLHTTEELVYGHGEVHGGVVTDGVSRLRLSLSVLVAACVLAVGWWLLRGRARRLVPIKKAIAGSPGPVPETWLNGAFQMVGVGSGLPVGREVAPREVAALMAGGLARVFGVDPERRAVLVAAAAGAGLGAVYQVPLAGAVYAIELMIGQASVEVVATCLAVSTIAVVVSRVEVSPVPQYAAVALPGGDWHLLGWAVLVGLLLGIPGGWFGDLADHVKKHSQRGNGTLLTLPLAGLLTATLAWWFPLVLGNGRSAAQSGFLGVSLGVAAAVLLAKCLSTFLVLRGGAVGGTLAPAIATGSMSGVVIGRLAEMVLPGRHVPVTALAVLGAVAVLATSLRAPASGLLLIFGVTGQAHEALLPLALCVAVAWGVSKLVPPLPLEGAWASLRDRRASGTVSSAAEGGTPASGNLLQR